jgi:hypothetical protein
MRTFAVKASTRPREIGCCGDICSESCSLVSARTGTHEKQKMLQYGLSNIKRLCKEQTTFSLDACTVLCLATFPLYFSTGYTSNCVRLGYHFLHLHLDYQIFIFFFADIEYLENV